MLELFKQAILRRDHNIFSCWKKAKANPKLAFSLEYEGKKLLDYLKDHDSHELANMYGELLPLRSTHIVETYIKYSENEERLKEELEPVTGRDNLYSVILVTLLKELEFPRHSNIKELDQKKYIQSLIQKGADLHYKDLYINPEKTILQIVLTGNYSAILEAVFLDQRSEPRTKLIKNIPDAIFELDNFSFKKFNYKYLIREFKKLGIDITTMFDTPNQENELLSIARIKKFTTKEQLKFIPLLSELGKKEIANFIVENSKNLRKEDKFGYMKDLMMEGSDLVDREFFSLLLIPEFLAKYSPELIKDLFQLYCDSAGEERVSFGVRFYKNQDLYVYQRCDELLEALLSSIKSPVIFEAYKEIFYESKLINDGIDDKFQKYKPKSKLSLPKLTGDDVNKVRELQIILGDLFYKKYITPSGELYGEIWDPKKINQDHMTNIKGIKKSLEEKIVPWIVKGKYFTIRHSSFSDPVYLMDQGRLLPGGVLRQNGILHSSISTSEDKARGDNRFISFEVNHTFLQTSDLQISFTFNLDELPKRYEETMTIRMTDPHYIGKPNAFGSINLTPDITINPFFRSENGLNKIYHQIMTKSGVYEIAIPGAQQTFNGLFGLHMAKAHVFYIINQLNFDEKEAVYEYLETLAKNEEALCRHLDSIFNELTSHMEIDLYGCEFSFDYLKTIEILKGNIQVNIPELKKAIHEGNIKSIEKVFGSHQAFQESGPFISEILRIAKESKWYDQIKDLIVKVAPKALLHSISKKTDDLPNLEIAKEVASQSSKFRDWAIQYQKKVLTESLNESIRDFLEDEDILEVITYVKSILNTPYTNSDDPHINSSWNLETQHGVIYRPNHGLSHTLTVVFFVPWLVCVLKNFAADTSLYHIFQKRHIKFLQLCMLFSVVGRQNDVGWRDNLKLYKFYREESGRLFEEHCRRFFEDFKELSIYKKHLIDMGNPDNTDPRHVIINMSHKLHLLRCFSESELRTSLVDYFKLQMDGDVSEIIDELVKLSASCIRLTGDQISFLEHNYNKPLFYSCNTDERECWRKLVTVMPETIDALSRATVNTLISRGASINQNINDSKESSEFLLKNSIFSGSERASRILEEKTKKNNTSCVLQ